MVRNLGEIGIFERSRSRQQIECDVISSDEAVVKIGQCEILAAALRSKDGEALVNYAAGGVIVGQERVRRKVAIDRSPGGNGAVFGSKEKLRGGAADEKILGDGIKHDTCWRG